MSSEEDLEMTNFQGYFMWLMKKAKENAPQNNGISVKARRGDLEAEITYSPPVIRYPRGGKRNQPKPLNLIGAQGIVAEYPDLLKPPEETPDFWFIEPLKDMGDSFSQIREKLLEVGFVYEKWQKDTPHTKGWRGKK